MWACTKLCECAYLTIIVVKTQQNRSIAGCHFVLLALAAAVTAPAVLYKFAHLLHFLLYHACALAHDDSHTDGAERTKADGDAGVAFFLFGFFPKHFILLSAVGAFIRGTLKLHSLQKTKAQDYMRCSGIMTARIDGSVSYFCKFCDIIIIFRSVKIYVFVDKSFLLL